MKRIVATALCLVLALTLAACQSGVKKTDAAYKEGFGAGYRNGYDDGKRTGYDEGEQAAASQQRFARFSGVFTATVEQLLPDYHALPGKTVAVVHFFQDRPFLLRFQEDMTDKLEEGQTYVFSFQTFDAVIPYDELYPSISDHMYAIKVTDYRPAQENETGLAGKQANVEIINK